MNITPDEQNDLNETIYELLNEFLENNILIYHEENFYNIIHGYITEIIKLQLHILYENHNEDVVDDFINNSIINCLNNNKYNFQFRSQKSEEIKNINIDFIKDKLCILDNYCDQDQNSPEWYTERHKYLTASSIWKIFSTNGARNSFIYNKCLPLNIDKYSTNNINIHSTLHWGHKYEPLSIKYYEFIYDTQIKEYGCIPHKKYKFLAASPDGINYNKNSNRYGRLLEIKNIVNRKITGIPKKEYWIQMQIQMEVCDLDECDFLETRFIEYHNENEFILDSLNDNFNISNDNKQKGIIIAFVNSDNNIKYEYAPLNIDKNTYKLWEKEITQINVNNSYNWFTNIYWKLDEVSCVMVTRNHEWFNKALCELENVWSIIQKEKKDNSYNLRSPKKRKTNTSEQNNIIIKKCKLDIDNL